MFAEMASVEVQREFDRLSDHLRSYDVVINGRVTGQLRPGESCALEIAPGSHKLYVKIDWCRSEKVDVHLTPGQTVKFRCAPRANLFTDLYWATLGRRRYIKLVRVTT